MNFNELARARRSQRSYDPDRPLPRDTLNAILETAAQAPSAANRQPWRILVLQSQAWLDRVHAAYPRDWFMAAPCVVVVYGKPQDAWTRTYDGYNALETDLAIFMDHLTLAAWEQGVGSCWIGNFEPQVLCEALELEPDTKVYALTPLGYLAPGAGPARPTPREALSSLVRWL